MRADYTHLVFLVDESGSMMSTKGMVMSGINELIDKQRKEPGQLTVTLAKFNTVKPIKKLCDFVDVQRVPFLDYFNYTPNGGTALLDAMGSLIDETGRTLYEMSIQHRPSKVVFIIQTDGLENASTDFTYAQISEKIQHQTEKYNWDFVFLGANMDAIAEARNLGIFSCNSTNFNQTETGYSQVYGVTSGKLSAVRSKTQETMAFTEEEQKAIGETT